MLVNIWIPYFQYIKVVDTQRVKDVLIVFWARKRDNKTKEALLSSWLGFHDILKDLLYTPYKD